MVAKASFDWRGGKELMGLNLAYRVGDTAMAIEHPIIFVLSHPKAMVSKVLHEIPRPAVYLFQTGGLNLFSGLSVFGLFLVPALPGPQREIRKITILLFSATWIALAFLTEGDAFAGPLRYFDVFVPLLLPWGIAGLMLCARSKRQQYTLMGLIVLYWLGAGVQAIRDPFVQRYTAQAEIYRQLAAIIPTQDVLAASANLDVPGIAWYADRRVVIIEENLESGLVVLDRNALRPTWYVGKDSDSMPTGYGKVKEWPGGLVLFHYSRDTWSELQQSCSPAKLWPDAHGIGCRVCAAAFLSPGHALPEPVVSDGETLQRLNPGRSRAGQSRVRDELTQVRSVVTRAMNKL
jgi:hypothetical protein